MFKTKTILFGLMFLLAQSHLGASDISSSEDESEVDYEYLYELTHRPKKREDFVPDLKKPISNEKALAILNNSNYKLTHPEGMCSIRECTITIPGYPNHRGPLYLHDEYDVAPIRLSAVKPFLLKQYRATLKQIDPSKIRTYIVQLEECYASKHVAEETKKELHYKKKQMNIFLDIVSNAHEDARPGSSIPLGLFAKQTPLDEIKKIIMNISTRIPMIWVAELITKQDVANLCYMLKRIDDAGVAAIWKRDDVAYIEEFYAEHLWDLKKEEEKYKHIHTDLNQTIEAISRLGAIGNIDAVSKVIKTVDGSPMKQACAKLCADLRHKRDNAQREYIDLIQAIDSISDAMNILHRWNEIFNDDLNDPAVGD